MNPTEAPAPSAFFDALDQVEPRPPLTSFAAILNQCVTTDAPPLDDSPDPDSTRLDDPCASGVPIVCGDGRRWFFAGPTIMVGPRFVETREGDRIVKSIVVDSKIGHPLESKRALADLLTAMDANPAGEVPYELVCVLACCLIRRCHDVAAADVARLLTMSADRFQTFTVALIRAALGYAQAPADSTDSDTDTVIPSMDDDGFNVS